MQKEYWKYLIWTLVVTLWVTLCFILPDFQDNPTDGVKNILTLAAYVCACGIGALFWVYIMGCSRWVCAITLPVFSVIGSALAFYRVGYHATLTPMLLSVTLNTNPEEAMGVISWQIIVWVIFNLIIAGIFIWYRWKYIRLQKQWIHCLIALAAGLFYYSCNARLQRSLNQRFPHNVPYNVCEYIRIQHSIRTEREIPAFTIHTTPDSLKVVLILGEAARADHLQLNGYGRETNPRLIKRENLVSLPNIYTDQTHTLASLPYILTRADSTHGERQYTETSFVSIFRNAGFYTSWISNQDLGTTFSHYLGECDTIAFANASKSVYVYTQWLDEDLIPILQNQMASRQASSLSIVHTIGSHWYFNNHVPSSMYYFQPLTNNRVASSNTIEELVNSYDNTIRYADFFVDSVITLLKDENAIVFYQSDHGEALGEDGYFLHANDAEPVKHPACIIWYSDKYAEANPEKIKALILNKDKRYRTDYVFYSILYAAGIEADGDCPEMNIFR